MANPAVRAGFHTVTPYLMVKEAEGLIAFVKAAFGATEVYRTRGATYGGLNVHVEIGNSMLMLGEIKQGDPSPATLFLYVEEVDAVYQQAIEAGAISVMEPSDRPEGDRTGGVQDNFGNTWYIATHLHE